MSLHRSTPRHGFTLIELSIVMVVLALLIGTVMAGREMMKAQELRQIATDAGSYITAFYQFKAKYGQIPGDFDNATTMWGRADGVAGTGQCAAPDSNASTGKPTCNGDGDGTLNWCSNLLGCTTTVNHESYRAWQHMAAADMIVGQYKGQAYDGAMIGTGMSVGYTTLPGIMYGHNGGAYVAGALPPGPTTPLAKTDYQWFPGPGMVNNATSTDDVLFDGDYSSALILHTRQPGVNYSPIFSKPVLTPTEMAYLDTKIDDGAAPTGYIRVMKWGYKKCVVSAVDTSYDVGSSTLLCSPIFMTSLKGTQ